MSARSLLLLTAISLPLCSSPVNPEPATEGLRNAVVFGDYTPLSSNTRIMRRLLSPLNAMRVRQQLAHNGQAMRERSIDLAQEKFAVYIPTGTPVPNGYALLVFVPPWKEARVPEQWIPVLDRHHMIYISAANSGNEANVLDRREPLSVLAEYNITMRHKVDPQRIYIGGFSGGARIALRLALAYPDVFRGALLDAGSDPIGTAQIPLPPADLFHRFQDSTRLVYLTGADDTLRLDQERRSQQSMHDWCVVNVDALTAPSTGHELADPMTLDRALRALEELTQPNTTRLADCRTGIDQELNVQLRKVRLLLEAGKTDDARKLLDHIDVHYGGLAAPRSTELAQRLEP